MPKRLTLRPLTDDEAAMIQRRAHAHTIPHQHWQRARTVWLAHTGDDVTAIANALQLCHATVRHWLKRFNADGLRGLDGASRSGAPPTYLPEQVGEIITTADFVDFLVQVDAWLPAETETVYAIMDNLSVHRSAAVLLFSARYQRWRFVFPPTYAPYLTLIEPWWKTLRSLALTGRRFESWEEIVQAIREATRYWNAHRHPFVWGRRRRRQPQRRPGIAQVANVA